MDLKSILTEEIRELLETQPYDNPADMTPEIVDLVIEKLKPYKELLEAAKQLLVNAIDLGEAYNDGGQMYDDYHFLSNAIDKIKEEEI